MRAEQNIYCEYLENILEEKNKENKSIGPTNNHYELLAYVASGSLLQSGIQSFSDKDLHK